MLDDRQTGRQTKNCQNEETRYFKMDFDGL